jgi:hypothetical protein
MAVARAAGGLWAGAFAADSYDRAARCTQPGRRGAGPTPHAGVMSGNVSVSEIV